MSNFSVRKPFTVLVMVIVVLILGVMSFSKMTADLLPSINLPYMIVSTTYIGASPEKVEQTITVPLEKTLATTENVKKVSSVSSENVSLLILQFVDGTNMDSALIELNNKIGLVKGQWTDSTIGTPTITKINPNMMPVMVAAVDMEDKESIELSDFVNKTLLPELQKVNGVASVNGTGILEEKIRIELNQDKIDVLNDKILNNVDKELGKAERDLKNAKTQIINGRNELNTQQEEKGKQITDGLDQIEAGSVELDKGIAEIERNEAQLKTLLDTLTLVSDQLAKDSNFDSSLIANIININQSKEQIKKEVDNRIVQTQFTLEEISKVKEDLISKRSDLKSKKNELEKAQITLHTEINKAKDQLNSSESQVNKGLQDLSDSKDEAYKKASLNGVITQSMISGILTADNFSMPAGYIDTENEKLIVKVGEEFNSLSEIENLKLMTIDVDGVGEVLLKDVADIYINNNSADVYAKVNGHDGIILSFQKQSTEATGTVADNIKDKFAKLEAEYEGLEFTTLMDQGIYITLVISSVLENLMYGAILAVIILLVFLRSIKPTIAIAISIPISLTFAITLMYFSGVSINIISLSGLALSVGMLVDNAIVVIENVYRLQHEGMPLREASIKGASSVAGALFASTLTTVAVFAPIIFVEGITRELFVDMALTIGYALLASFIVALTVIPALTSKLFKNVKITEETHNKVILKAYDKTVKFALSHKVITLSTVLGLFVGSIIIVTTTGTAFMPEIEGTQMSITLNFDKETTTEEGNEISNQVIEKLLEIRDIEKIGSLRSSSALGGNSNSISMYIILDEQRRLSNKELEKEIYSKTDKFDCEISVSTSNMDMSALGGSGIEITITGNELEKLQEIAKDMENKLKAIEGISTVDNGIGDTTQELKVNIDKNKAIEYGLTVAEIYSNLADKLTTEKEATSVSIENKDYPLVVIKSNLDELKESTLESLELDDKKDADNKISISDIAKIEKVDAMNSIRRENSERYITVTAQIDADHNIGLVSRVVEKELKDYEAPAGYNIEIGGESETINEAIADLFLMVALAVVLIYLIMVAQFQSLRLPFIIMFTIPLAFTGGLIALFITGQELSVISMIGFLMLSGIIVNNGIVLIDYINQLIESGKPKYEAIVEAGETRLRPILMTALTTILGMSTMALGFGMGSDMVQPLGIVVIGGMMYATILTLVVVPCMYDIVIRDKKKKENV